MPLAEVAAISQRAGGGLIASGTFIAPPTAYDAKRSQHLVITTL